MRKYFGTDGIRGVANEPPLTPEFLVRLGSCLAQKFLHSKGRHRILIAKDTRLSGYMIEHSLTAGITSAGADVLLTGPIPTPALAYLTWSMRCSAGIMISASHNPFEDNGIKIFGADGRKLPDTVELEIEAMLDAPIVRQDSTLMGKATRINDAVGRYAVFLKESFPKELTLEGMKLGLDCANGAGYAVAPLVFQELGADVVSRGISPNGKNINAGFGSLYPEVVKKLVVEQKLDFGLALDGDGDRAVIVDDTGSIWDGDKIIAALALDLKDRKLLRSDRVVATVMSNLGLENYLTERGIKVERAAVGDRYVLERMNELGLQLGGEQSGHIISLDHATSGDGILTALLLLGAVQRTGKKLSELLPNYVTYPQLIVNVQVKQKRPLTELPAVQVEIARIEKELGEKGRVLVRYSGTENKLRIMLEAESEEACSTYAESIAAVVRSSIG